MIHHLRHRGTEAVSALGETRLIHSRTSAGDALSKHVGRPRNESLLVEAVPPRPKKPSAPAALRKLVRGACQRPDRDPFGQFGLVNRVELSLDGTFMRLLR
jgi:hypothetical protein